jgi:hypothetical protein
MIVEFFENITVAIVVSSLPNYFGSSCLWIA